MPHSVLRYAATTTSFGRIEVPLQIYPQAGYTGMHANIDTQEIPKSSQNQREFLTLPEHAKNLFSRLARQRDFNSFPISEKFQFHARLALSTTQGQFHFCRSGLCQIQARIQDFWSRGQQSFDPRGGMSPEPKIYSK